MSSRPVRAGVGFFGSQASYVQPRRQPQIALEIAEQARRAESLGFDSFWIGEHHFAYDGYCPAPIPALARVAAATEVIAVGAGVIPLPLHSVDEIARHNAALGAVAAGRARLAFSVGYANLEFMAHREPIDRRRHAFEERLDALLRDSSLGATELWIGGGVPAVARRAGRYGASLLLTANLTPERISELRATWEAELVPRQGQEPRLATIAEVFVGDDAGRVESFRARYRESKTVYESYFDGRKPWADFEDLGRAEWLNAMAERLVVGTGPQVVERLAPLVEAGADDVIFGVQHGGASHREVLANIERLAAEVVPALQGLRRS